MENYRLNNDELKQVTGGQAGYRQEWVYIDPSLCLFCASCVDYCPTGAIMENAQVFEIDQSICLGPECGACLSRCPMHAISVKKEGV